MTATSIAQERHASSAGLRAGGIGGLVFVVLGVVAGAAVPPPPAADASASKIRTYLVDHGSSLRLMALGTAIAALGLVAFFAVLRRAVVTTDHDRPWADALFGFGLLTVAVSTVGSVLLSVNAHLAARSASDDVVQLAFRVGSAVFYTAPGITMTGALLVAAMLATRGGILPKWSTALATIAALVGLLSSALDLLTDSGSPGAVGLAGFLLTVVWTAAISVAMLRTGSSATST